MLSRGEETGYRIYYDMTLSVVNAVIFVNAINYTAEFHKQFADAFKVGMGSKNLATNDMLVLCINSKGADITEQMSVAHQVCAGNSRAWIYDEDCEELIVYEDQVEEFFGLRRILNEAVNVTNEELDTVRVEAPPSTDPVTFKERIKQAFHKMPKAASLLVLINVLVFILCETIGTVIYYYGSAGLELLTGPLQYYRVISSIFLHVNIVHLFSNMLLLYFAGAEVEEIVKPGWFLFLFFLSGIAGNITMFALDYVKGTSSIVIGASGAVYGVLGAMLALVMFKRLRNGYARLQRVVFAIFIAIYSGFLEENIANGAHIGGLVAGIIVGIIYCIVNKKQDIGKKNEN